MHGDQQRTHRQPQVSQLEGKREREQLQLQADTSATRARRMCAGLWFRRETRPMHSYTDISSGWPLVSRCFGLLRRRQLR